MTRPPPVPLPATLAELGAVGDAGALAHYSDPAYYTKTYEKRLHDVVYYVELAQQTGGPVLEYGIGNGRVALPLARAGVRVCGVDLSQSMLVDLRARLANEPRDVRRRVRYRHGDMRFVRLGERFPLVIVPFNGILHLYETEDVDEFFARVFQHLEPGGRFVFDFSLPIPADLARDPERWYGAPRIRHPSTGELVRYAERFEYDPIRQLVLVTMRFQPKKGEPWTIPLTHRQFFPREVEALLRHAGFSDIGLTADFSDLPADRYADSIVVSCRRPRGPRRTHPPARR